MSLWGEYLQDLLDLSFNGVSLQDVAGGQVTDHNFDEMPEIKAAQNTVSASHRSITAGRFFVSKRASVSIAVKGEFHELQAILARFRQLIQYKNKDLVLTRGVPVLTGSGYDLGQTVTVTYKQANVVAANLRTNSAKQEVITVEFVINDPIGVGGNTQTLLNSTGVTGATTTIDLSTIDLQGTFQEQYPIYKFTINSITPGSNPTLSIALGLTTIVISQALAASDVLIVDTDAMRVTLNGELIDFSGGFPFIADPDATITITNTFSARNMNIEVKTNPRYI
ncbi:MAG TPA: hypothetical protein PK911_04980 [Candidatus Saccharibacteria bacterium]|nr:hypothetical protein [Candidatus Saccharibacteria bacterium]